MPPSSVTGTPLYIAPEILREEPYTEKVTPVSYSTHNLQQSQLCNK